MTDARTLLKQFINSDDPDVASVAAEINQLNEDLSSGAIDKDMYTELVNDALELAKVRADAKSLDTKIRIEKVVDVARQIAGFI